MAKKSRIHIAKDWLVIIFCLSGLVFFLFASADHLSQLLSRPLVKAKNAPTSEAAKIKAAPTGEASDTQSRPTDNELATLFSGASSLALIMFSLLLAFAAIIGWQSLRHDVESVKERAEAILEDTEKAKRMSVKRAGRLQARLTRRVNNLQAGMTKRVEDLESSMKKKNDEIEEELRGRATAVMGNLIGTLHSVPTEEEQSEEDKAYLAEAVYFSQQGYRKLEKLPGNGKYMALNNLVYYSTLLRLQSKRDELLGQARDLLAVGRKYDHLPYAAPYLMTYARAILVYSSDLTEHQQALGIIREVLEKGGLTSLLEREARYIETSLSAKLGDGQAG